MTTPNPRPDWSTRQGLIAALLTPFADDGSIDLPAFDAQLAFVEPHRPLAVSVAAVEVQDYHVLTDDQRVDLVARAAAGTDIPVVAGVTAYALDRSVALAQRMADAGAAAVLAVAQRKPWGAPPTADEAVRWFTQLADASGLPLVLYTNPATGVDLDVDVMTRITAHPNVCAVKETSRHVGKVQRLCRDIDKAGHAGVFTNMESLHATLSAGGRGAMLPPPGLAPATAVVTAVVDGDQAAAADHQAVFTDFPSRWLRLGLGPVMKAAMREIGCPVGNPVRPYDALNDDERRSLSEFLHAHHIVPAPAGTTN